MSSSVSNISFRYHPEDEELDDNYDTSSSISTTNITVKPEGNVEENTSEVSAGDTPNSVLGRLGIREPESDKWKLLSRITKSVEEKIVEIKTERLRNQSNQRRTVPEQSSVSDSEEPSESSQVSVSDKSTRSTQDTSVRMDKTEDTKKSSDSQGSSPERSLTPVVTPDEIPEEIDVGSKKGKRLKGVVKKKKGKIKNEKSAVFDRTTISYSALVDNESDSETIEVAQEVQEEITDTQLARELDRLAHPSLFQRVVDFVCDWHIIVLPLVAFFISYIVHIPQYLMGFVSGVVVLLVLQKITQSIKAVVGWMEPMPSLKDVLPLTGLPIFKRSIYDSDMAESKFEGWMNEYRQEYHPETYHMTLTETVWVTLEGSMLKLSVPRSKIPKRALWSEPRYKLLFTQERLINIANCKVELRPEGLIPRRIWSKKYPICIVLNPTSKVGVRYKDQNEETVDEDTPWVDESKYNFDRLSEDSDEERPSIENESLETLGSKSSDATLNSELDENRSVDSIAVAFDELETPDIDTADPDDFVKINEAPPQKSVLYLFARTHREKDIWFRRFTAASKGTHKEKFKMFENIKSEDGSAMVKVPKLDYLSFMMQISQRTTAHIQAINKENSKANSSGALTADLSISSDMMWVNAFIGRMLFDVYQDSEKLVKIQEKIQKKLSAIKLPLFLEQLEVRQLELGSTVPVVQRASRPILNAQGVWVDLDVVYEGGFKMTVDTKLNMDRIKQTQAESPTSDSPRTPTPTHQMERKSAAYDSQIEDSAETSSEEPDTTRLQDPQLPLAQSKFIRYLDKVAKNKTFQQVIDYKFIKKFVQGNNLQLEVEVKGLLGTLVLNIPPQPSDRIWFGFRTNPKLWLSAKPKFGQHAVHVISRIIEKKLSLEFQRVLVLPNMEDILVPLMDHNSPR